MCWAMVRKSKEMPRKCVAVDRLSFGRRLNGEHAGAARISSVPFTCLFNDVKSKLAFSKISLPFSFLFCSFRFSFVIRCTCVFISFWLAHVSYECRIMLIRWICELCTCNLKLNQLNDQTFQRYYNHSNYKKNTTIITFYSWTIFKNFNVPSWFRFYYFEKFKTDSIQAISELMNHFRFSIFSFCYNFYLHYYLLS